MMSLANWLRRTIVNSADDDSPSPTELAKDAILAEMTSLRQEVIFHAGRWERANSLMAVALGVIVAAFTFRAQISPLTRRLTDNYWLELALAITLLCGAGVAIDASVNLNMIGKYIRHVLAPSYRALVKEVDSHDAGVASRELIGVFDWEDFRGAYLWSPDFGFWGRSRSFWLRGAWALKDLLCFAPSTALICAYAVEFSANPPDTITKWIVHAAAIAATVAAIIVTGCGYAAANASPSGSVGDKLPISILTANKP